MAFTGIGITGALFPQPEAPIPAPRNAPDYLATIRAPTPTPEPEQTAPVTTTHVDRTDLQRLAQWMASSAWLPAVAAASRAEPDRLLFIIATPQDQSRCYRQLTFEINRMAADRQLLSPTSAVTQAAVDCLDASVPDAHTAEPYLALSASDRAHRLADLLRHHSIAGNPLAAQAAAEPSPVNIGLWRTAWPHQQHCRDAITELAAETAAHTTAQTTVDSLSSQFDRVTECLSEPLAPTATPQPSPTINSE